MVADTNADILAVLGAVANDLIPEGVTIEGLTEGVLTFTVDLGPNGLQE